MNKKEQRVAVNVDIGATNLRVALVREDGKILKKLMTKTPQKGRSGKVVTDKAIAQIKKLIKTTKKDIVGIGVSVAGRIDAEKGVFYPPNLPFKSARIVAPLQKAFHVPISFMNDANAAALAVQHFEFNRKVDNITYITMSSGIGCGAIVDGRLLWGDAGNAAELGHIIMQGVYEEDFLGWEDYASGENIPKLFASWCKKESVTVKYKVSDTKALFRHVQRGDRVAVKFMDILGKINARGIIAVILAYNPEVIVLGGSVILHNEKVLMRSLKKHLPKKRLDQVSKITVTKLGDSISLLGAAAAVFKETAE